MRLRHPQKPDPEDLEKDRKILGGPIFSIEDIRGWVSAARITIMQNAESDVEYLEWTEEEVALAIRSLKGGDYRGSEWCQVGRGTNWLVDCDVYKIALNNDFERHVSAPQYYLKFTEKERNGVLNVVMVRCHLDR